MGVFGAFLSYTHVVVAAAAGKRGWRRRGGSLNGAFSTLLSHKRGNRSVVKGIHTLLVLLLLDMMPEMLSYECVSSSLPKKKGEELTLLSYPETLNCTITAAGINGWSLLWVVSCQ